MILRVILISIIGMGVVFAFLFLIFLILSSFKYIFKKNDIKEKTVEGGVDRDIAEEEVASIMTAISYYHQDSLKNKRVIINRIGGGEG